MLVGQASVSGCTLYLSLPVPRYAIQFHSSLNPPLSFSLCSRMSAGCPGGRGLVLLLVLYAFIVLGRDKSFCYHSLQLLELRTNESKVKCMR